MLGQIKDALINDLGKEKMALGKYDQYFITEPISQGKFAPRLKFDSRKYFGEKNFL